MKKKKTTDELSDTDKFRAMYAKVNPNANMPYLVAVLIALLIGIGGVTILVSVRPDFDILVVSGVVFAFLTPATTSILSLMNSREAKMNSREAAMQAKETYHQVNSRLTDLIDAAKAAARAEGVSEGEKKANDRTDALREKSEKK